MSDRNSIRRAKYQLKKLQGICVRCDGDARSGSATCQSCADKDAELMKKKRQSRVDKGVCVECGEAVKDRGLCVKHLEMRANRIGWIEERRQARLEANLCFKCGEPAVAHNRGCKYSWCETCYLKVVAKNNLGNVRLWKELKVLFESQSVCPYTGRSLVLGVSTTLDHKTPVSKGGSNDISNLQWVYFDYYGGFDVNRMKGAMTDQEYREAIAQQFSFMDRQ